MLIEVRKEDHNSSYKIITECIYVLITHTTKEKERKKEYLFTLGRYVFFAWLN